MDIQKILERIKLDTNLKNYSNNLKTLNLLMKSFLANIPYENLDFSHKKIPSFNILRVYEKIVENNRGGICYETNSLFAYLLSTLGFKVDMIFTKVKDLKYIAADYPHLALIVQIDNIKYLVDVGFAQNTREAMNINDFKYISESENISYKIDKINNEYILFKKQANNDYIESYSFTEDIKTFSDFDHLFSKVKIDEKNTLPVILVSKAKDEGRVTLYKNIFSINTSELKRKWQVNDENRNEILRDYFDIEFAFDNQKAI